MHGLGDVLLFARVVVVAAQVPWFVRLSLPRQAALLSGRRLAGAKPERAEGNPRAARPDVVDRVARCVDLAQDVARPLVRPGCLTRGITLYWFLGRSDEEIELCFGLGHPGDSEHYSGHCWLSRRGQPILERVDPTDSFGVVYRFPPVPDTGTGGCVAGDLVGRSERAAHLLRLGSDQWSKN